MEPKVAGRSEWLEARRNLERDELGLNRLADSVAAKRRQMPMVKIDKRYNVRDENNRVLTLTDLFDGNDQLVIYHFMFAPSWTKGCDGCTHVGECLPDYRHFRCRNTSLVFLSRAAPEKLRAWKQRAGWTIPWFSTIDSDLSWDLEHMARDSPGGLPPPKNMKWSDEDTGTPGFHVFYKKGNEVFHQYTTFQRGAEKVMGTCQLLDMTPLGRQDNAEGIGEYRLRNEYGNGN